MNRILTHSLLAISLTILTSCETTDDPRAGGLWGYMATGDAGYQRRINDRQGHLSHVEDQTSAEASRNRQLQGRRSSLLSQRSRLSQLRGQALGLTGGVALAGRIHSAEQNAENIGNLEARIKQLEGEVAALRRRQ